MTRIFIVLTATVALLNLIQRDYTEALHFTTICVLLILIRMQDGEIRGLRSEAKRLRNISDMWQQNARANTISAKRAWDAGYIAGAEADDIDVSLAETGEIPAPNPYRASETE